MPKVSVLVPSYNYGKYISQCLDSILDQTYKDFEIVIIDDCSTDNSINIIQPYLKNNNIKFIHNSTNIGLNCSKKIGLGGCSGDYLTYLDADDIMYEEFLEMHVEVLDNQPDIDLVYCNYYDFKDDNIEDVVTYVDKLEPKYIYEYCVYAPWSMYRRKWYDALGHSLNLPNFVSHEDWDYWITLASYGCKAYQLYNYLVYRRLHGKNISWTPDNPRDEEASLHYIALRHPSVYPTEEALKYVANNRPQYINDDWLKPIDRRGIL